MLELRGPALLAAVTSLTSLGFLMIGYDNGLLGGLGGYTVFTGDIKILNQELIIKAGWHSERQSLQRHLR